VFEPFPCDKESVAPIARNSSLNCERFNPWFSIVFSKKVTYWVIPSNKTKVSIEAFIFFEISVVSFIDRSIEFELLVDLFEELGRAKVIISA